MTTIGDMIEHPYGSLSLIPPVAAIVLAIATRRVIASLFAGLFAGALVTAQGDPIVALVATLETHLWTALSDPGKLRVFSFTLLMGAMIGVINRSGGMRGLVDLMTPLAANRRRGQLTAWLLGLLVFFDDYANTLLLGNTLRPVFDRLQISREKLAYVVDSTAAPVAGLALVSTWVAVEIDYVQEGIKNLGPDGAHLRAFDLFVASIPYRFYVLMALLYVPLNAWWGRDFGPMLVAERARLRNMDQAVDESATIDGLVAPDGDSPVRWYNAALPIAVTLTIVVWLIVVTGHRSLRLGGQSAPVGLRDVFGAADSSLALQYGALAGLVTASVLARVQRILHGNQILEAAGSGARVVLPAIMILWMASAVSRMTGNSAPANVYTAGPAVHAVEDAAYPYRAHRLYTGEYLKQVIGSGEAAGGESKLRRWFPTLVFALSAVVAFCTGTSWGTMGILMPTVIAIANSILTKADGSLVAHDPLLLSAIAGVLSGAIFGDHCSPISDTTVLSSQSSGCDHIAHVRTQMPYAVVVAAVTILLGTLPLGLGVSCWALLPLQLIALCLLARFLGRPVQP